MNVPLTSQQSLFTPKYHNYNTIPFSINYINIYLNDIIHNRDYIVEYSVIILFIILTITIITSDAWQRSPCWVELRINAEGWGKCSRGRWKLQRRCDKQHEGQVVSMQEMTRAL
jgi:hypothetical protein